MKKISKWILAFLLIITVIPGCELIGDILEVGIWIGIILVVLVVAIIFWIIRKIRK
jgi:hypothetical protein